MRRDPFGDLVIFRFSEITENASRELAKDDRFLHSFFASGGITEPVIFATPLMVLAIP